MRTAENYVDEIKEGLNHPNFKNAVIKAINEARIDVIRECAEAARLLYHDGYKKENRGDVKYFQSGSDNIQPDKQSILNLIDQVK